jgi:HSP20 family protein
MNFDIGAINNFIKIYKNMLPIRHNTYKPSLFFGNILDDLFSDISTFDTSLVKTPIHDVIETDKEYIVEAVLAGVKKEDVSIDIDRDVLTIKAERKETKEVKETQYNRKETYFGKYERSFILPDSVDIDNINASLVDGMLKVVVPKLENNAKLSKKKIEIN